MDDSTVLRDRHGRMVNYLRMSVTDRCNLRCLYCAPQLKGMKFLPHSEILTYEECLRLVGVLAPFGIKKIRLTGGEPFARLGFMNFVRKLRLEFSGLHLAITTNATMLRPHLKELKSLGLCSLNISLDSFTPGVFFNITGMDLYHEVYAAVLEAVETGLRVKLNAVALKGINDFELPAFIEFARKYPVDVRFIEYMPMGGRGRWSEANFWPAGDIYERARHSAELVQTDEDGGLGESGGPAKLYQISGGKGRFGIITPISKHFCQSCNRLRITSDGRLRPCLFSDREYRLRPALRNPKLGDEHIYRIFAAANQHKPLGGELLQHRAQREKVVDKAMFSIGG